MARRGERGWAASARACGGPTGGRARGHSAGVHGELLLTCVFGGLESDRHRRFRNRDENLHDS